LIHFYKRRNYSKARMAEGLLNFINVTPTPFHLVKEASTHLEAAGFTGLEERDSWALGKKVSKGGKYFYQRNGSTIVAFTVGNMYEPGNEFKVVGAHTDSPVLKIKPVSTKSANGYMQVGVECYGGGLWHTWFDRDLTVAGSVIVKNQDTGGFERRLVHVKRPLVRVPSLCIHLQSAEERKAFSPNKETHLQPVIAMLEDTLNKETEKGQRHSSTLLNILANELSCSSADIMDMELSLCDTQPGQVWGANNEFLSSPRLDNQSHCYTGLTALLSHAQDLSQDTGVSMLVCFDHEEVGSDSTVGAGSPMMGEAVSRVLSCLSGQGSLPEDLHRVTIRNSFLVSADVAHAVHPNYSEKHEGNHRPVLNGGTVIKSNSNQRYATNAETGFLLRELARRGEAPIQEFVVRNDCPCGSTIGPIIASKTGIRTVDLGVPSLSMHSIRETMGVKDVTSNIKLFETFFKEFGVLDKSCSF